MRTVILDLLGLTGFGLMSYGVYLKYGADIALIGSGVLLLLLTILASRGKQCFLINYLALVHWKIQRCH